MSIDSMNQPRCPFCPTPCGNSHCPYSKGKKMILFKKLKKPKRLKCGHYAWEHRPEATFMKIWTCIESWRNKK